MTQDERNALIADIAAALHKAEPVLTSEEIQYVRMAIKKEAQSIAFRNAVIEKSLIGLIWAALVGVGYILKEWFNLHGFKG